MEWLSKYRRLSRKDQLLVVQVTILVLVVRIGLRMWSLPRLRRHLSRLVAVMPVSVTRGTSDARRIIWAVQVVGRRLLGRRPCLTQALVVDALFRRAHIPATLHIGVARGEEGKLEAHAWVESEGVVVIGGPASELARYAQLLVLNGASP